MSILKKILLFISCCFTTLNIFSQQDSVFTLKKTIPGNFQYFTTDNLDNIYLIDENNQLKKINGNGDSVGVFNEVRKYGKLFSIDAANPLKTLLFYKNFSTIVVLDRFLNIRNVVNLRKQNIFNAKAITTSFDNNIWLFDEGDARLKKIGEDGTVLSETVDLRTIFENVPSPEDIIDSDGFVYLYDSAKGFYIFDYYGSYKNNIPFLNWMSPEVFGKTIYGFGNSCIYQYETGSLQLKQFPLPVNNDNHLQIRVVNSKMYILQKDGLQEYRIK